MEISQTLYSLMYVCVCTIHRFTQYTQNLIKETFCMFCYYLARSKVVFVVLEF